MKINKLGTLASVAAVAVLTLPTVSLAQPAPPQVRSCRNFVGRALEMYNQETIRSIQITETSSNPSGEYSLNWQVPDGSASGSCVVSGRGEIVEYRRNRSSGGGFGGGGGQADLSLGREIPGYQTQVVSGGGQNLLNRPFPNSRQTGFVNGGETVTVSRSFVDNGNNWFLVRNNQGQQGWISSRSLGQASGGGGNFGSNPGVDYNIGRQINPTTAQVSFGNNVGSIIFGGGTSYELMSRPDTGQGGMRPVGVVNGGERVTAYRFLDNGDADWVLVRGSRGQEGWIQSRRLIQTPNLFPF
jgi:hypothetical protein